MHLGISSKHSQMLSTRLRGPWPINILLTPNWPISFLFSASIASYIGVIAALIALKVRARRAVALCFSFLAVERLTFSLCIHRHLPYYMAPTGEISWPFLGKCHKPLCRLSWFPWSYTPRHVTMSCKVWSVHPIHFSILLLTHSVVFARPICPLRS